jgi:hypothetical protein
MIPYLLAAVGGYLIGQSRKDEQYARGGMTRKGGKVFEVDGKKFYYHKDGLVYDDKHILYGGRYSNLDEAYLSVKRNESLNKGTSRMDYGGMMADGGEVKEYASGGYMAKGGVLEHGLRKGDKIVSEMYNIAGVINEDSGEAALVDIETGKREEIK